MAAHSASNANSIQVTNAVTLVAGDFNIAPQNASSLDMHGPVDLGTTTHTITNTGTGTGGTTFSGVIGGSAGVNLDSTSGILALYYTGSNANTYTGTTTVGAKTTLNLDKTNGVNSIVGDLVINSQGTVQLYTDGQIATTSTVTDNGELNLTTSIQTFGTLNGNGTVLTSATGILNVESGSFSGEVIVDNGSSGVLMKTGAGTFIVSGDNTYTGSTVVADGTLQLGASDALPAGTHVTLNGTAGGGDATLDLASHGLTIAGLTFVAPLGGGSQVTIGASTLTLNGDINFVDDTGLHGDGGFGFIGSGTLDLGGATRNITVAGNNNGLGGDLQISADIQNGGINYTGNPSTLNSTPATLGLYGNNTYSGPTTINDGILQADSNGALSPNSGFDIHATGKLDLRGNSNTIGSLTGSGTVTDSSISTPVLTTGNDNTNTAFSGVISDGAGTVGLTKIGTGTFDLTGASTYTGATNVNVGQLIVDGSIASSVQVNSGAAFSGTGNVGGLLTNSGGTVSIGTLPGTLTIGGNFSRLLLARWSSRSVGSRRDSTICWPWEALRTSAGHCNWCGSTISPCTPVTKWCSLPLPVE